MSRRRIDADRIVRRRSRTDRALPARAWIAPGLVLLAAAAASPLASGDEELQLRTRLKPESAYDQTISMRMSLAMEMAGLPKDQAEAAGALTQGMTQEMEMALVMDLGALEDDGAMPVAIRLEKIRSAMIVAGQRIEPPAGTAEGATLASGRITPRGKLLEMRSDALEQVPSVTVERLLEFMPQIADRSLRVGESFELPLNMTIPLEGADAGMEGKAVYTLRSIAGEEATFDVEQTFAMGMEGGAGMGGMEGMSVKAQGKGSGSAVFDASEGIFKSLRIEMQLTVDMDGKGTAVASADAPDEPPAAFKLRIQASGPMVMTVSRRPSR